MQGIDPKKIPGILKKAIPELTPPKKEKTDADSDETDTDDDELEAIKKNAGITKPAKPAQPGQATV